MKESELTNYRVKFKGTKAYNLSHYRVVGKESYIVFGDEQGREFNIKDTEVKDCLIEIHHKKYNIGSPIVSLLALDIKVPTIKEYTDTLIKSAKEYYKQEMEMRKRYGGWE